MYNLELVISMIDGILSTRRKRHIVGGILISAAFFFSGLAFTALSIKTEEIYG